MAKFAASTKAQARYLFPFLVLPLPLRLPQGRKPTVRSAE
jgi:hypothetical protein